MGWQSTPFTVPLFIAGAVSCGLTLFAWRRRAAPGARTLALLMLGLTVWTAGNALELTSADLPGKIRWIRLQYLGIVVVPTAWLALALQYTGRGGWLTRGRLLALTSVPLVTLVLAWTNESHGLFWSSVSLDDTSGSFVTWVAHGRLFWAHVAYSYALLLLGCGFLIQAVLRSPRVRRAQARTLLLAVLAPWAANALSLAGLSPLGLVDLTPFAFTLSGIAFAVALFRFGFLDLVPIARAAVVEGMEDAVFVLDAQERIVDLNPAGRRILGPRGAGAVGRFAADVFSGGPALAILPEATGAPSEIQLGEGDDARSYEVRTSSLHAHTPSAPGQPGDPAGRVIVLRDITVRKLAEEALRRQNEYHEALHETTLALMNRLEVEGLLQAIVVRAGQLVGTPHGYIYLVTPDGAEIEQRVGLGLFAGNASSRLAAGEGLGGTVWASGEALAVDDYEAWPGRSPRFPRGLVRGMAGVPLRSGPTVVGVLGLGYDPASTRSFSPEDLRLLSGFAQLASIAMENARLFAAAEKELAERQRAQEELQRSETRYRELVETATDIIYRTDTAGRFTYVNPTTVRVFGFPQAELIGRSYVDFVRPDWRARVREFYLGQYFNLVPHTDYELPIVTGEGRELWLGCSVHLLLEHGAPQAFYGINRDITDRKRVEQLRDDLTHTIVHDLRNPLTPTLGFLELLQLSPGALSPRQREMLEIALRGTRKVLDLVGEILDARRLEEGALSVQRRPVLLAALVSEVLDLEKPLAQEKGLLLVDELSPGLPPAWADPGLVGRILQNLVGNAIKFTPTGGTIRVGARLDGGDPRMVRVSVADTGPGIPADLRGRLFQKFATGRHERSGTGLGLAFCRLAVEAHGGRIREEGPADGGARFVFTLPLPPS